MKEFGTSPAGSLVEEQKAAGYLLQILKQEQEKLVDASIDGLAALTEEKAKTVARMTELANWRHRALAAAGFEGKESSMQAWLESSPMLIEARKNWTDLLAIAQSAKELNRTNGLLINRHMVRNQNALNVLQGAPQGGNIYGPNGQTANKAKTRGLVVG